MDSALSYSYLHNCVSLWWWTDLLRLRSPAPLCRRKSKAQASSGDVCFCVYDNWCDVFFYCASLRICRETLRRDFCPTSANGAVTSPSSGQSHPRVFTPPGGTWLLFVHVIFIAINNAEYISWCLSCCFTVFMCKIVKCTVILFYNFVRRKLWA